jgi:minor extracellular serine protease Vpr
MAVLDPELELLLLGGTSPKKRVRVSFDWSGSREELAAMGLSLQALEHGVAYVSMPLAHADKLRDDPRIGVVELASRTRSTLDESRKYVSTPNTVGSGGFAGPTGKGVVVAIVDDGIDVFHQAFRRPDTGGTRILRLWRMGPNDGIKNGYLPPPKGRTGIEYRREHIEAVVRRLPSAHKRWEADLRLVARIGKHGTGVAGIAAGNGRQGNPVKYGGFAGIAPDTEIICVAVGGSSTTNDWAEAFNYIDDVLNQMTPKRPASVINLSQGAYSGPRVQAGPVESKIAKFIARTKLCLVVATGNEGGPAETHAEGSLKKSETAELTIDLFKRPLEQHFPLQTPVKLQLWYNYAAAGAAFEIKVVAPDGTVTAVPLDGQAVSGSKWQFAAVHATQNHLGGLRGLALDLQPKVGTWKLRLKALAAPAAGTPWHAWLQIDAVKSMRVKVTPASRFSTMLVPNATADLVSVASYLSKDRAGVPKGPGGPAADTSSRGPSPDGKQPTVTAPGEWIASSVPPKGKPGNDDAYGLDFGTSFAAPHVTGAVALMLEKNPKLGPRDIALQLGSGSDKPVPGTNADPRIWGAGRLNIKASII